MSFVQDRVLANMKFIGQLFLRSLLSAKIIGSVIQDLTNCEQARHCDLILFVARYPTSTHVQMCAGLKLLCRLMQLSLSMGTRYVACVMFGRYVVCEA